MRNTICDADVCRAGLGSPGHGFACFCVYACVWPVTRHDEVGVDTRRDIREKDLTSRWVSFDLGVLWCFNYGVFSYKAGHVSVFDLWVVWCFNYSVFSYKAGHVSVFDLWVVLWCGCCIKPLYEADIRL
jgi:hypothetical protein